MIPRPELRALAHHAGIAAAFVPQGGGAPKTTSDDTCEALLTALGFDASTEAAAARALRDAHSEAFRRGIAPFGISHAGGSMLLEVHMGASWSGSFTFAIDVIDEHGGHHSTVGQDLAPRGGGICSLPLPRLEPGYHDLRLVVRRPGAERESRQTHVVAPARCLVPEALLGEDRCWGIQANLYALRDGGPGGIGSMRELHSLVHLAAGSGGDFVGIQPLHALRGEGSGWSPYSPSSRLFRSPLYVDWAAVPGWGRHSGDDAPFVACSAEVMVPYATLDPLIRRTLRPQFERFRITELASDTPSAADYRAFVSSHGDLLRDFGTFQVLGRTLSADDWRQWPAGFRTHDGPGLDAIRAAHADEIEFECWVQFELDRQLEQVAGTTREQGMRIGLYQDLAVGSDRAGFDAWRFQDLFLDGASVGAPPDQYSGRGQDWGFPPLDPRRLAQDGFSYWIRLLRTAFRHSGALRIDHVLGLHRQWWIPYGRPATEGAYVHYPERELLGILALESERHQALVIGEDLGTVPDGLSERLREAGVCSTTLMLFERDEDGSFRPPERYPSRSLVSLATHDFAPLAGLWSGRDLELRQQVEGIDGAAQAAAVAARNEMRAALLARVAGEHPDRAGDDPLPFDVICSSVYGFLAKTPSKLLAVSIEDLAGEQDPVNLPGVPTSAHPSWRRRLPTTLNEIHSTAAFERTIAAVSALRPRRSGPRTTRR